VGVCATFAKRDKSCENTPESSSAARLSLRINPTRKHTCAIGWIDGLIQFQNTSRNLHKPQTTLQIRKDRGPVAALVIVRPLFAGERIDDHLGFAAL